MSLKDWSACSAVVVLFSNVYTVKQEKKFLVVTVLGDSVSSSESCCPLLTVFRALLKRWTTMVYFHELPSIRIKGADIFLFSDVLFASIWARPKNLIESKDADLLKWVLVSASCVVCTLASFEPCSSLSSCHRPISWAFFGESFLILKISSTAFLKWRSL